MSKVVIQGDVNGTGIFTVAAPNSNSNRSLTLPDAAGTLDRLERAGNVLQVVQTTFNTPSSTTSTSWATLFSASITPTSTSNKVLVIVTFSGSHTNNYSGLVRVLRNATAIGGGAGGGSFESNVWFNIRTFADYNINTYNNSFLDSPSSTSSTTYNVQWVATGGIIFYANRTIQNTQIYDSPNACSITLMEIAA